MSKLQIIIGSTRPARAADRVAPWVIERATSHAAFEVEVLDLRDWPLPMFAEHFGTVGDFNDPTYSFPIVRQWNQRIKEADAYLVVTPEYNHSVPGVLKNAIDSVWVSFAFRNKPLVAVGYSGGIAGGVRAIEHLAQIAIEAELVFLRTSVVIPQVSRPSTGPGFPSTLSLTSASTRHLTIWRGGRSRWSTHEPPASCRPPSSGSKRPPRPSTRLKTKRCDTYGQAWREHARPPSLPDRTGPLYRQEEHYSPSLRATTTCPTPKQCPRPAHSFTRVDRRKPSERLTGAVVRHSPGASQLKKGMGEVVLHARGRENTSDL